MINGKVIDYIRQVANASPSYAGVLVPKLLPGGHVKGGEWVVLNPTRGDRKTGSFFISLSTGQWYDFATGEGGGDLVSLVAYIDGVSQYEAALTLAPFVGMPTEGITNPETLSTRPQPFDEVLAQTKQERARRNKQAAILANTLWCAASEVNEDHPYLLRKQVPAYGLKQLDNDLLVPLRLINGELVNIQRINPEGKKRFLAGGQVKGAFCLLGEVLPDEPIYICEGWATGATLLMLYAETVACAMNAGNLLPVAREIRLHHGLEKPLVIAGDDDRKGEDNPGMDAANHAAAMVGAMVASPEWSPEMPLHLSDFNDLHVWGLENGD